MEHVESPSQDDPAAPQLQTVATPAPPPESENATPEKASSSKREEMMEVLRELCGYNKEIRNAARTTNTLLRQLLKSSGSENAELDEAAGSADEGFSSKKRKTSTNAGAKKPQGRGGPGAGQGRGGKGGRGAGSGRGAVAA